MSKNKAKMAALFVLVVAACASAVGYMWWRDQNASMPAMPASRTHAPRSSAPAANKTDNAGKDLAASPVTIPVAGNVGKTSELLVELEELKLETQIAELRAKKRQLNAPPAPPAAPRLLDLPPISPVQPQPLQARSLPQPEMFASHEPRKKGLVSVQGVDGGELTATMRDSSGKLITLKQGMRFGNSVVTEISREGVTLKNGNRLSRINFD